MDFDVVIMGGGLVGATLAACLARDSSVRIAVVEKFSLPHKSKPTSSVVHPSYDARNTALSNGTCSLFQQLGLWESLRALAEPIKSIDVTDQGGFGQTRICAEQERVRALGYVIENRFIGQALMTTLQGLPNVEWVAPAAIQSIRYTDSNCEQVGVKVGVHMEGQPDAKSGREVSTPLLVIADGAESSGRQLLGIEAATRSYDQVAIVTNVTPDRPHGNRALERFTREGPLAILPQTDNRLGLTWCMSEARATHLLDCDEDEFLRALETEAGDGIGTLVKLGQRYRYPLALTVAKEQVRPNVVVLGNAAHSLHPVAGQGLNMALRDVAVLVQVLHQVRQQPADRRESWGDFQVLSRYLNQRQSDQDNTIRFSDSLTRLFSRSDPMLGLLRNSGLLLFESVPGAKRFLARYAMGRSVSTRLPECS